MAANQITDDRAALLTELNRRMGAGGHDLQIGPSYVMRSEIRSDRDLDRVWRYDILPLLEEHYYGRLNRAELREHFGIGAMRAALAKSPTRPEADQQTESEAAEELIDLWAASTEDPSQES